MNLGQLDHAMLTTIDSDQCLQAMADLEAIDFFLAQELQQCFDSEPACFPIWLALHWALRQGHTCLDLTAIAGQTLWQDADAQKPGHTFANLDELRAALDGLDLRPEADQPVVRDQDRLYLRRYWSFEKEVAERLAPRLKPLPLSDEQRATARAVIDRLFPEALRDSGPHDFVDWQAVAVANAVTQRFCIVSGGPGTGKTYAVARLLACLQEVAHGTLRIQMAAPTGKAKQRLQESIGAAKAQLAATGFGSELLTTIPEVAHTLHGLLGVRPDSTQLRYHAEHPLPVDLLLIDEASMVDLPMMTRVLRALPVTARLVLIGDANQLPSIAVGSVLLDLAPLPHRGYSAEAAETIERLCGYRVPVKEDGADSTDFVTVLHKSHRFDGSGGIGRLAESVTELDAPGGWQLLQAAASVPEASGNDRQLSFVRPEQTATWLEQAVAEHYAPLARCTDLAEAFKRLAAFRVLVPTRVGPMGVEALNLKIETWLARGSARVRPGRHYHGRPIMVTRNQPALGVYNGDVGLVWQNGMGNLEACFELESGTRRINLALLPAVEPVYAMTIHKTQGSEFGKVALLLPERAGRLLSSELVYTGITRAKQRCVISASEAVWQGALATRVARWSGLRQRVITQ